MKEKIIKSRERVQKYAEVYTPSHIVKEMCDFVGEGCRDIRATFLEPACGNGNFLAEILERKLGSCSSEQDFLIALSSLYGIDILADNVQECRERLLGLWVGDRNPSDASVDAAKRILERNIICGNFLSCMEVDKDQKDTDRYITFTKWEFDGRRVEMFEHRLIDMLEGDRQLELAL